jgi:5-methyltetrahydropteroyltriglutamate--homocysteine methyltransferase
LREVQYLTALVDYPFKVTFPAPSYWYCEAVDVATGAYESQQDFIDQVVEIQRELLAEVIEAGARHVQMDWPAYVMAIDPAWRSAMPGTEGDSLEDLIDRLIQVDNAVIQSIPDEVTTALHICRGNYRSMWMTEGSLEPVAEQLFNGLKYDRLLIEWDDVAREGDYSPLRFVPNDGPVVVMGVVSTKTTTVESPDEMVRRIEEAAAYIDVDKLAISPQCGFASTWEGNELAEQIQWEKLACVVEVADRVWGRS